MGGRVATEDGGSDSDDCLIEMLPAKATLRPVATTASMRTARGGSGSQTPSKPRSPVTQVHPLEPRRLSARAHHPCAPWFRPAKGAIEPRPSRRSLSAALSEEPLMFDHHNDVLSSETAVDGYAPQVVRAARASYVVGW